ncbi:MAG: hypothetical protein LBF60_10315 [Treponema sp.]|nr:hypothetical protein [Treponema sp.]
MSLTQSPAPARQGARRRLRLPAGVEQGGRGIGEFACERVNVPLVLPAYGCGAVYRGADLSHP